MWDRFSAFDTPLAKAIGYARNQREALHTFLRDGRIPIHSNGSERELRRLGHSKPSGGRAWAFCRAAKLRDEVGVAAGC